MTITLKLGDCRDIMPTLGLSRMLEIGKAAEHLVCADLILSGYRAFLADQGCPYDIVLDVGGGKILRVQVRATLAASNVNIGGVNQKIAYRFAIRRSGKGGRKRITDADCDVVALVALDIKVVAYLPIAATKMTIDLISPGSVIATKNSRRGWARPIDQFPIARALSGDDDFYRTSMRQIAGCKHGHGVEFMKENCRGAMRCLVCFRTDARERGRRKRAANRASVSQ